MIKKIEFKIRSLLDKIISFKPNFDDPNKYWDFRFNGYVYHHSRQNIHITNDFINNLTKNDSTALHILQNATSMLEVGCGTGELSLIIAQKFPNLQNIVATDISAKAIKYANKKNKHSNRLKYLVFDSLNENKGFYELGKFDISICSNVLEHFSNPYILINQMQEISKYVYILVPYNHLDENSSIMEGGAGHIFQFNESSFNNYKVIDSFKFKTKGWDNIKNDNDPKQFFVLLKGKL